MGGYECSSCSIRVRALNAHTSTPAHDMKPCVQVQAKRGLDLPCSSSSWLRNRTEPNLIHFFGFWVMLRCAGWLAIVGQEAFFLNLARFIFVRHAIHAYRCSRSRFYSVCFVCFDPAWPTRFPLIQPVLLQRPVDSSCVPPRSCRRKGQEQCKVGRLN